MLQFRPLLHVLTWKNVSSPWRMGNMGKPKAACITNPSMKGLFCESKTMGYLQNPPNRMKYATVIGKRMINTMINTMINPGYHGYPVLSRRLDFWKLHLHFLRTLLDSNLCLRRLVAVEPWWKAKCRESHSSHNSPENVQQFLEIWENNGKYRKMEF